MSGKKKRIKGDAVQWIAIPQYESLTIDKIAAFVAPHGVVADYLPETKEISKLPKQWIANVCHTLLKKTFSDWVKAQVNERSKNLLVKKNMLIDVDSEIAEAFHASTKTSGKSATLSPLLLTTVCYLHSPQRHRRQHAQGRQQEKKDEARGRDRLIGAT